MDFLGDHISPLRGATPSNFYKRWGLTKACCGTPQRGQESPKNFNREHLKFCLKFSMTEPYITSGLVRVSSRDFARRRVARHE